MKKILKFCVIILATITCFVGGGFLVAKNLDKNDKKSSSSDYFVNYFAGQSWLEKSYMRLIEDWERSTWDTQTDMMLEKWTGEVENVEQLAGALYGDGGGGDIDIILNDDINLSDYLCNPIGNGSGTVRIDGQGHTISGIRIIFDPAYIYDQCGYETARIYVENAIGQDLYRNGIGLFAHLYDASQITNVTFSGTIVFPASINEALNFLGYDFEDVFGSDEVYIGGLGGFVDSGITTVGADFGIYCNMECTAIIGGLAGMSGGLLGCYSTSYICRNPAMEDETTYTYCERMSTIGGLAGIIASDVVNACFSSTGITLVVNGEGTDSLVGGLVGTGTYIMDSYSLYDRFNVGCERVGGLAGTADGIQGCYSSPALWSENTYPDNVYPLAYEVYGRFADCVWNRDACEGLGIGPTSNDPFDIDGTDGGKTTNDLIVSYEVTYSDWAEFYTNLFYGEGNNYFVLNDNDAFAALMQDGIFLGVAYGYPVLNWLAINSGSGGGGGGGKPPSTPTTYYEITYDGNGGTTSSGATTTKQSVQKNQSFQTKSSDTFTKAGYEIINWSTSPTSVAGSYPNVSTSYTYTEGKDITLYAIWGVQKNIKLNIRLYSYQENGSYSCLSSNYVKNWSISYYYDNSGTATQKTESSLTSSSYTKSVLLGYNVTFNFTPLDNYKIVGYSRATSEQGTITSSSVYYPTTTTLSLPISIKFSSASDANYIMFFFKEKASSNVLKYDSSEKYFYFEDGYFPQSYVGNSLNSTLNSASSGSLTLYQNLKYLDGSGVTKTIPIYAYNSNKYAKVTNNGVTKWFKVEAIRWRVSDYGVSSTAYPSAWPRDTIIKNFKVVSDRVLWVGAITATDTKESWKYTASEMYDNVSNIYTKDGQTLTAEKPQYVATSNETFYYYGEVGQQEKVKKETKSISNINVATEAEISLYLTSLKAKASDLVAFLLGLDDDSYCDYWTRELGVNLKNAKMVTNSGMTKSSWLSNCYGVRFSLCMAEGSRV